MVHSFRLTVTLSQVSASFYKIKEAWCYLMTTSMWQAHLLWSISICKWKYTTESTMASLAPLWHQYFRVCYEFELICYMYIRYLYVDTRLLVEVQFLEYYKFPITQSRTIQSSPPSWKLPSHLYHRLLLWHCPWLLNHILPQLLWTLSIWLWDTISIWTIGSYSKNLV